MFLTVHKELQEANERLEASGVKTRILFFADSSKRGGATVLLASGEPCILSIAQSGIVVKKSRHFIFGPVLYNEKSVYLNARRTGALAYLFPDKQFPDSVSNPNLRAFFNAILHCRSAVEVCTTLNEAIPTAEAKAGRRLDDLHASDFPAWSLPGSPRVEMDGEQRGNVVAGPRGNVLPTAVDKSTTDAACKNPSTFLQGFQSVPTEALRIMGEYGALIEDFPDCVIDTSWLPADKEKMKDVLKLSWLKATNDEARNRVETGWYLLSGFQDGVGQIPIQIFRKTSKNIPIERLTDYLDEQRSWLQRMAAECELLSREFDQFKQTVAPLKARS